MGISSFLKADFAAAAVRSQSGSGLWRRKGPGCLGPIFRALLCGVIGSGLFASGCASSPTRIASSPWTVEEQQRAILKIVPIGTARLDAIRKLKEAGIEVTQGGGDSVYYCDVWNRQDGKRWQIDVALLFDKTGTLYQTRQAQSKISRETDDQTDDGPSNATPSKEIGAKQAGDATTSSPPAAASTWTAAGGSRRSEMRTPFSKPPETSPATSGKSQP